MEVVCIKKILARNLLIYIYLHCLRRSSWTITTLATLAAMAAAVDPPSHYWRSCLYVSNSKRERKKCYLCWFRILEFGPSSIYSCSIDHILEHEFCHLGCWAALWAVSEKFLKRRNFCLSMLGVVFSWSKKYF